LNTSRTSGSVGSGRLGAGERVGREARVVAEGPEVRAHADRDGDRGGSPPGRIVPAGRIAPAPAVRSERSPSGTPDDQWLALARRLRASISPHSQ
jgi:hypothetical protein